MSGVGVAKAAATRYQIGGPFLGKLALGADKGGQGSTEGIILSAYINLLSILGVRGMLFLLKKLRCLTHGSGRSQSSNC